MKKLWFINLWVFKYTNILNSKTNFILFLLLYTLDRYLWFLIWNAIDIYILNIQKMCSYIIIIILHNENENYVNALCVYVVGVGLSVMVIIKYVETTNEVHAWTIEHEWRRGNPNFLTNTLNCRHEEGAIWNYITRQNIRRRLVYKIH